MRHIGLLGGSFDPVHRGHLAAARAVMTQLDLAEIWFLPAAQSPFKERPATGDAHRVAMLELAIASHPGFRVDTRELDRPAPSYTVDTLRDLCAQYPDNRYYLILGMDAWQDFEHWHEWQDIARMCQLVVMTRPGYARPPLNGFWQARVIELPAALPRAAIGSLVFVSIPASDAASNLIRKRIAQGKGCDDWLASEVRDYIGQHGLYHAPE